MLLSRLVKLYSGSKSLKPLNATRFYSSSDEFIILSPKQAGLVKPKPKRLIRRPTHIQNRPLDLLQLSETEAEPIVSAIHSQRPEKPGITQQRFTQIARELTKGFKKSHLEDYLQALQLGSSKVKKMSKLKMVEFIMKEAWNCFVKDDDTGGTTVENIMELSEPEFVLTLAKNGRILREWSKSGAKVSILPARCQIIINSTPKTFEWINASLGQYLGSISWNELDLTNLNKLIPLDSTILSVIQRITDTYFSKDRNPQLLRVYSAGRNCDKHRAMVLIKRLLLQVSQSSPAYQKWRPSKWWFDVDPTNNSSYKFMPFSDTDSQEWIDRTKRWCRWEAVKVKSGKASTQNLNPPSLSPLNIPEFDSGPSSIISDIKPIESQLALVIYDLIKPKMPSLNGEPVSTTLTASPGYILHNQLETAALPNTGTMKTFSTNLPYVANLASSLPLFNEDIHHDTSSQNYNTEDIQINDNKSPAFADPSSWESILKFDDEPNNNKDRVFVNRHKDLKLTSNIRLVQMKFVPDIDQPNAFQYPPIEAWGDLPVNSSVEMNTLEQVPRLIAVPLEANAYVSLPQSKADLRFTYTQTHPVQITEEIESYFMKQCSFGKLGPIFIEPTLQIIWEGQPVTYRCLETNYVILAELEFQGQLLQLSQVEGGKLGGRRIEASLIRHISDSSISDDEGNEVDKLRSESGVISANALKFTNSL